MGQRGRGEGGCGRGTRGNRGGKGLQEKGVKRSKIQYNPLILVRKEALDFLRFARGWREVAVKIRKMTAEGLLHRYNCAQVQGLLLRCEGMTVTLPESGPAKLRQLLKYLRFNKLLANITQDQKNKKG